MIDPATIDGQSFAIIMVFDDGSEDGEWVVTSGLARWRDGRLGIDRGAGSPIFPIPEDTYDRIKPVDPDTADILNNCAYSILLRVGPKPEDDPSTYIPTGFKWPS